MKEVRSASGLKRPAGQSTHAVAASPSVFAYWPASQETHTEMELPAVPKGTSFFAQQEGSDGAGSGAMM